jgi:hypothetical protein
MAHRRPRLALPFTVLTDRDTVRLVAGEDFRYTLSGQGLDGWLPGFLAGLDGRTPLDRALGQLPQDQREQARQLVDRLYGERVLIDGTAADAHTPVGWRLAPEGSAAWAVGWQPAAAPLWPLGVGAASRAAPVEQAASLLLGHRLAACATRSGSARRTYRR